MIDVAVILLGAVAGILAYAAIGDVGLFIPYVVAHFFLFCNVFRIRRPPELVWAFAFLLNCGLWALWGDASVYGICASQLLVSLCVIAIEVREPLIDLISELSAW